MDRMPEHFHDWTIRISIRISPVHSINYDLASWLSRESTLSAICIMIQDEWK